jgi:transcriptional regulator with XRE-family HTH domain
MNYKNEDQERRVLAVRKQVGELVKKERIRQGLSYYMLGKKAGLTIAQLHSIEDAKRAYTADSFFKIMGAINATVILEDENGTVKKINNDNC